MQDEAFTMIYDPDPIQTFKYQNYYPIYVFNLPFVTTKAAYANMDDPAVRDALKGEVCTSLVEEIKKFIPLSDNQVKCVVFLGPACKLADPPVVQDPSLRVY